MSGQDFWDLIYVPAHKEQMWFMLKELYLQEIVSDVYSIQKAVLISAVYFGPKILFGCFRRKQTKEKKTLLLPNNYVLGRYVDEGRGNKK